MALISLLFSTLTLFYIYSSLYSVNGLLQQSTACFDVFDESNCNSKLWEVFEPSTISTDQNIPTTKLYLFTTENQDTAEQIHDCAGGLPPSTTFNEQDPTIVVIHGYNDGVCRTAWMREYVKQFYLRGSYNVILVDWTWGDTGDLMESGVNARFVGRQLAFMMQTISDQKNYDCSKFHVIGHGFGGHAAASAGKESRDKCPLGRITALEYFLPMANYTHLLSKKDAKFVDVIHTNAGTCFPLFLGYADPIGHVDFYVNDGTHQYSCILDDFIAFLKIDIITALYNLYPPTCFHMQAIQYFKASINASDKSKLIGAACDNYDDFNTGVCSRNCADGSSTCAVMGMDAPSYVSPSTGSASKVYYVPTSLMCPYNDHTGFQGLPLKSRD